MRNAIIVTPFDSYSYSVRVKYLENYFSFLGYSVKVYSADFDHRKKEKYLVKRDNLELINVPKYKKNISISRIYSHYVFSKKITSILKKSDAKLVYVSGPPNLLYKMVARIKNRKFKLIFEVGDMWPETIPINNRIKKIFKPLLNIWSSLRNKSINKCDAIIYECDLFRNKMKEYDRNKISKTIYLSKPKTIEPIIDNNQYNVLRIVYIGSINNIIDIDLIQSFLLELKKYRNIQFVIIGDGENKKQLLEMCNTNNIEYEDYGIVYDENRKKVILMNCSFGLNVMKNTVCVGMTMKSLEYFYWGLGIINNIPADSEMIINDSKCGFNISHSNICNITKQIADLSNEDIIKIRNNSRNVYLNYFDEEVIKNQFLEIVKELDYDEEKSSNI